MDTMQATYALSLPALDPFGGPHFTGDDEPVGGSIAWVGDPSSVPLPSADRESHLEDAGTELDREIFAALVAP